MRALTIKQPWADAITHGTKRTENRTWVTPYRGLLLIHAGASYDPMGRFIITDRAALNSWPDTRRAIIATAELTDCHPAVPGCCAPWGEPHPGTFHWTLTSIRPLARPVPANGALRLWRPAPDICRTVDQQAHTL